MYLGSPSNPFDKQTRTRERSFSTPLEPNDAYYANELSHLRTEALPRLRHLGFKVDTEWAEAKSSIGLSANDANAFEQWWAQKTCTIVSLNEQGKRLATAHGLGPTGRGWCAP
jgi:phage gp29-like protein